MICGSICKDIYIKVFIWKRITWGGWCWDFYSIWSQWGCLSALLRSCSIRIWLYRPWMGKRPIRWRRWRQSRNLRIATCSGIFSRLRWQTSQGWWWSKSNWRQAGVSILPSWSMWQNTRNGGGWATIALSRCCMSWRIWSNGGSMAWNIPAAPWVFLILSIILDRRYHPIISG